MTHSLSKITRREIKNSFGRFLAMFFIVLLGAGFLMGLRTTRPAMLKTLNDYNAQSNFFDFQVMTNLGVTEEDVAAFSQLEGVSAAEGAIEMDAMFDMGTRSELVMKVHALPQTINKVVLREGRMPQSDDECVLDGYHFDASYIGQTMTLSDDNEHQEDFTQKTYTVVGLVNSPLYINFTRGTTTLGNGTVSGFVYVQPGAFSVDYFTDVYVRLAKTGDVYTDEYDNAIEDAKDRVKTLADQRAQLRYDSLRGEAEDKYADGLQEYQDGVDELNAEKETTYAKLNDALSKIQEGERTLATSRQKLDDGWAALNEGQEQITQAQQQYDSQKASALTQFAASRKTLDLQWEQYRQAVAIYGEQAMAVQKAQLEEAERTYTQEYGTFVATGEQLAASQTQLDEKRGDLEQGEKDYADGVRELSDSKTAYEDGVRTADEEFAKAQEKLDDAKAELDDARADIDGIAVGKAYVLDRYTNSGYASFESDSSIVDGVAKVFPLFFFLVAALVCMTTMNRMIDTQRTQIGTLKSLGYRPGEIIQGYLLYSGTASLTGSIAGVAIGSYIFPQIIWKCYNMMYGFKDISPYFDWLMSAVVCAAFVALSLLITWWSCKRELREVPAELIRPEAPKPGKRIFLERVTFIWKRFSFLSKVSARNIFRYKKRMFMMIVGIAGCMSLLLTAFGLNDSITGLGDSQFHDISLYDGQVTFRDNMSDTDCADFISKCGDTVQDCSFLSVSTVEASVDGNLKSVYLMGTDTTDMSPFMHFALDGTEFAYPKDGEVLLNDNLAELLHVEVGDSVTFQNADMNSITMTISGIYHNVVYNYAYTTRNTIRAAGYSDHINSAYLNFSQGVDGNEASTQIGALSTVGAISLSANTLDIVNHTLSAMAYVVLLISFCAGALAFIVLYNLTNININERIREIATIKVLGFRQWESASYVFRENFVLTLMGAAAGIPLGIWLHGFVMGNIRIDMISFDVKILLPSYLLAIALTILFAAIVDFFMYFRLNKINMAESLKAAE
jgi:putative ABC transport system permease protein